MKKNLILQIVIGGGLVGAGIIGGYRLGIGGTVGIDAIHVKGDAPAQTWTCSMHPHIRQDHPGKCPLCGMSLIPLLPHDGGTTEMQAPADVQTIVVRPRPAARHLRLYGALTPDESRRHTLVAHTAGRIESLAVHSVGETVAAGQAIARLYSPALYSAQEELLEAHRLNDSLLINAARQRLQHLKVGAGQIAAIESGGATATLPIEATYGGTVIEKSIAAGDYVEAGAPLFEVADLSTLWAVFEAYEGDLPHLRLGDEVRYTTPSLPGEHFLGRISYIAPLVDPLTRTTQVRLQTPNPKGRLRPGMYLVGEAGSSYEALSLPRSAVLWTGARSIVYVKADDGFHLREVELGAAIDDGYIILSGLSVGEEVVTRGAFLLDAAAQLGNLPSMMSSSDNHQSANAGHGHHGHNHNSHPSTPQPSHHHHHH